MRTGSWTSADAVVWPTRSLLLLRPDARCSPVERHEVRVEAEVLAAAGAGGERAIAGAVVGLVGDSRAIAGGREAVSLRRPPDRDVVAEAVDRRVGGCGREDDEVTPESDCVRGIV